MKTYEIELKGDIRDSSGTVSTYVRMDMCKIKPISHDHNTESGSLIFRVMATEEDIEKALNDSFLKKYVIGKKEIKE